MNIMNNNNMVCFYTTRDGGVSTGNYASFNLSEYTGDEAESVLTNRARLLQSLGEKHLPLIIPHQTHSNEVRIIDSSFLEMSTADQSTFLSGVDALVTDLPEVCIAITTADCVPIVFFDEQKKVIGVAHAGWRGTCGKIAKNTVEVMINKYGCTSNEIKAYIGPSISPSVYEVGMEVIEEFEKAGFETSAIATPLQDKYLLNLWEANIQVLEKYGIERNNIELSEKCTFTELELFFSARRLGIKSGRILSGAYIQSTIFSSNTDSDIQIVKNKK